MVTRRAFALALPWLGAAALPAMASTGGLLRFVRIRHRTMLIELDGRRVLVDPSFEPAFGAPGLVTAPAPAFDAGAVGDVDLVLVTGCEPGAFGAASARRLRDRAAPWLVPDEGVAKALRHQGFRRVRVVAAGQRLHVGGVDVVVSPSASLATWPGVGFHLSRGGRTLWCAGAPPPIDVDGGAAAFAKGHPAEVAAVCALGLAIGGTPLTLDADDAELLARLARARYLVPLHLDATPTGIGALVLTQARALQGHPPAGPRLVVVPAGTWCRVGTIG
ncbi:MAG: MBL fold metallo-hydrolase [Deltaproteobacteria bacterium]|nr:MBL fold metallo-hydrolase [Deltaproteobacteria bacterium]